MQSTTESRFIRKSGKKRIDNNMEKCWEKNKHEEEEAAPIESWKPQFNGSLKSLSNAPQIKYWDIRYRSRVI